MLIAIPNDKFTKWTKSIKDILSNGNCTAKELERLMSKLVRTSRIMPGLQCFLKLIRTCFYSSSSGLIKLSHSALDDLRFWLHLLLRARDGVNINTLLLRLPSSSSCTDASGFGMGGIILSNQLAWRCLFPKDVLSFTTINHLEFLAIIAHLLFMEQRNLLDN